MLSYFDSDSEEWATWRANLLLDKQAKKETMQKIVTIRYSITYYIDILTHILTLIEERIIEQYKVQLSPIIDNLIKTILEWLSNINLDKFKEEQSKQGSSQKIHPVYFQDTIYTLSKITSLVCRLLQKNKSSSYN
jgi:hypothetical protein